MATFGSPTGQVGDVSGDAAHTTDAEILSRVAAIRRNRGLPSDPASDRIWLERVQAGTHTIGDARTRIEEKAASPAAGGELEPPEEQLPDPREQARQARMGQRASMRATLAWLPDDLLNAYVDEWVRHGDGQLAWGVVRTSPTYKQHFPGITRDDGTLRMNEQDYLSHRDAFRRSFTQWGLNPQLFEGHHVDLIEGDVSIQEFRQRMDAKVTGVIQNLPQVRERYSQFYGIGAMDDRALIAAALDPDVGLEILQGRITSAQVGAEAAARGFQIDRGGAERLTFAGGLDQQGARQVFTAAQRTVPQMDRFARRFNDRRGFGLDQFTDASVFGDADEQQRMSRLGASEQSLFRQGGQVQRDQQGALRGLQRR